MVVLGIAPAPVHPLTDGAKVFQTLDGDTRIYVMPFALPCAPGSPCLATADEAPCASAAAAGGGGGGCRGSVMWQLSFPLPEGEARALSGRQAELKAEALRRCAGWHPPIATILESTAQEVVTGCECAASARVGICYGPLPSPPPLPSRAGRPRVRPCCAIGSRVWRAPAVVRHDDRGRVSRAAEGLRRF